MSHDHTPDDRDRETADADSMSYTPGAMEDKESASARANRLDQSDTTSLRPRPEADAGGDAANGADEDASAPSDGGDARRQGPGTVADPLR